ncbi:MAG: hypothetical protein IKU28_05370 [Erysipelotrichaceae bacterium]|nr:hypothetical protein [Erysipelotrichaceae bacterium]
MIICIFALLGKELIDQRDALTIDERIERFNQQVIQGEIIDVKSHIHLNQTQENAAGRLGETLSEWIYNGFSFTMETIALFFDEN